MTGIRKTIIVILIIVFASIFAFAYVEVKNSNRARDIIVSSFDDCVINGGDILESFPRQCVINEKTFVEEIEEEVAICVDSCGNGTCEEIVCLGQGCPCSETIESCPSDCSFVENPLRATTEYEDDVLKILLPDNTSIERALVEEETNLSEDTIKTHILEVPELKNAYITKSAVALKNLRPGNITREVPFKIGDRDGFKWIRELVDITYVDYYTYGTNQGGSVGVTFEIDPFKFNEKIENNLDNIAKSIQFL